MNNGSLIDQNEKLIELLKHSTTKLSAKKIDRFSNMIVMIQHKSETFFCLEILNTLSFPVGRQIVRLMLLSIT